MNVGDCPPVGKQSCGDPISLPTGNVFETVTDYLGVGPYSLTLTRFYNSASGSPAGSFGAWRGSFDRGLSISASEVDVTRADGKVVLFFPDGSGGWSGLSDLNLRLSQTGSTWTFTDEDDTVETYTTVNNGLRGLLSGVRFRNGYTQTLHYNGTNQLASVTDVYGRALTIAYSSNGKVSSVTCPDGKILTYGYTGSSLTQVTYPTGPVTSQAYIYDDPKFPGVLTGMVDENGARFGTWTYDQSYPYPRATSSQHAGGADLTTVAYGSNANQVTVTRPLGVQEVYKSTPFQASVNTHFPQYLSVGTEVDRLATATTSAAVRKTTYDARGYVASQTDWNGIVTTFTSDARGNETSRTVAVGTPAATTVTTTWHPTFRLPTQITQADRSASYTYDANGNMLTRTITWPSGSSVTSFTYNATGQILSTTDPVGHSTTYAYDAHGNLTTITNALGQATHITSYDANGRPLAAQDPNGLAVTFTYDARGRITSETAGTRVTGFTYDGVGQLTKFTRPDGSFLTYSYDAAHRRVGFADSLGRNVVDQRDAAGNLTKQKVFGGGGGAKQAHSFVYDAIGRLLQSIGADGQTTAFTYDPEGNLTKTVDPLGRATSNAYDGLDRLVQSTDAKGGVTGFAYDHENRLTRVVDARGIETSYGYDGLDDVLSRQSPDTGGTVDTYDAAGDLKTSVDGRGKLSNYSFDALHRITKAGSGKGNKITYQYDQGVNGIGHLTGMVDSTGRTGWSYNAQGDLIAKSQTTGAVTLTTLLPRDAAGRLSGMTYPSGTVLTYAYDANGEISGIQAKPAGAGASSPLLGQVAYRPFGDIASWVAGNGSSYSRGFDKDARITALALPGSTIALAYDASSRITGMTETGRPDKTFGYDKLDRLTTYAKGADTQAYGYDAVGNRTALNTTTSGQSSALVYGYDAGSNRLLNIQGTGTESFSYDNGGNTLADTPPTGGTAFAYSARNRLLRSVNGATTVTYGVNGLGERVTKGTDIFVYDEAGHLIGQYDAGGAVKQEFVWLRNLPVAVLQGGGVYAVAPDQIGAPNRITDFSGQIVWRWDHDPFGRDQPTGSLAVPLRFPGQVYDAETGLNHNGYRDYDPRTGRYIESDPIGLRGGLNTYAYAGDNPLGLADPVGLDAPTVSGTLGGFTGTVTAGKEGVQMSGGFSIPGGVSASGGLGKYQPPTIGGESDVTIKLPFVKIICKIEDLSIKVKPDKEVGFGIKGGTTQTAGGPVIPWSDILPQDSPLRPILTNPDRNPLPSGYK